MKVKITAGSVEILAELLDNETGKTVFSKLPISSTASTWGDEIYFKIPVHVELDSSAKEVVSKGDLGFWPSGDCFCIFFGPTPNSKGDEIRPASAVNVFGNVTSNLGELKKVKEGENITIEKT
ncbi:hypothetical protein GOV13_02555 [Candidatus Pacearchaeota archaeon]|nr:hypothetical protein [Candidatus Pacearchaeota archaeon]